jgi:hypothetical protein
MSYKWLPELDDTVRLIANNPYDDGWSVGDASVLKELSNHISVNNAIGSKLSAIPDIFERARLFEMAIFAGVNDAYSTRNLPEVEEEWRAILTVIVLSATLNVTIESVPFYEPGDRSELERITGNRLPDELFWQPPAGVYPMGSLIGFTWKDARVFLLCTDTGGAVLKQPIAYSSPNTLIIPTSDCWDKLWAAHSAEFPWIRRFTSFGGSKNPETVVATIMSQSRQYAPILMQWLSDFREYGLGKQNDPVTGNWVKPGATIDYERIFAPVVGATGVMNVGLLQSFVTALGNAGCTPSNDGAYEFSDFAALVAPRKIINASDILMTGIKALFVDTESEYIGSRQVPPDAVRAIDGRSLTQLRDAHKRQSQADRDWLKHIKDNGLDLYFTDELLLDHMRLTSFAGVRKEECADLLDGTMAWEYGDSNPLRLCVAAAPLTEAGFKLMRAHGFEYSIDYSDNGLIDRVTVRLTVQLDPNGKVADSGVVVYERTYTEKDKTLLVDARHSLFCDTGIWPRKKVEGWKSYYLFCMQFNEFSIVPVDEVANDNKRVIDCGDKFPVYDRIRTAAFYKLDNFPEYLKLLGANQQVLGYFKTSAETVRAGIRKYKASIDFGTSSTVIFNKQYGNDADETDNNAYPAAMMNMEDLGSGAVYLDRTRREHSWSNFPEVDYFTFFFVPHYKNRITLPFASLLHDFKLDTPSSRVNFFDSMIFHKMNSPSQIDPDYDPNHKLPGRIHSNLKWGNDNVVRLRLDAYFQHLARYVILDALMKGCNQLKLVASYPGAMMQPTEYMAKLYKQFLNTRSYDVKNGALTFPYAMENDPHALVLSSIESITEGRAAAQFFSKSSSDYKDARCIIDIGGGSSDYFVYWLSEQGGTSFKAYDSSIKFGARDLLVKLIFDNIKKLEAKSEESILYKLAVSDRIQIHGENREVTLKEFLATVKPYVALAKQIEGIALSAGASNDRNGNIDRFTSNFEAFLSIPVMGYKVGDILHSALSGKTKLDEGEKKFLTILAVGIGALAYYGGLLARNAPDNVNEMQVTFAGSGAKVLNWLLGANDDSTNLQKFVSSMFKGAINRDCEITIADYSPHNGNAKTEAASGMFPTYLIELAEDAVITTLAGEEFESGGATHDLLADVSCIPNRENLLTKREGNKNILLLEPKNIKSDEFNRFCETFNAAIKDSYGIGEDSHFLPLEIKGDTNDYGGVFKFDPATWDTTRNPILAGYLNEIANDSGTVKERKSFFMVEIEHLISILREKL